MLAAFRRTDWNCNWIHYIHGYILVVFIFINTWKLSECRTLVDILKHPVLLDESDIIKEPSILEPLPEETGYLNDNPYDIYYMIHKDEPSLHKIMDYPEISADKIYSEKLPHLYLARQLVGFLIDGEKRRKIQEKQYGLHFNNDRDAPKIDYFPHEMLKRNGNEMIPEAWEQMMTYLKILEKRQPLDRSRLNNRKCSNCFHTVQSRDKCLTLLQLSEYIEDARQLVDDFASSC